MLIVALIVSEVLLFSANQQKHFATTQLNQARHETERARADLEQLKSNDAAAQSALRAENQNLSRKNLQLLNDNKQLAQQLGTARETAESQQQHLEQLQNENEQIAANNQIACLNNLRQIDAAKQQWALEFGKAAADVPTAEELLPYLPGGIFPICPSGGIYEIGAVGVSPTCSVHGQLSPPPQ